MYLLLNTFFVVGHSFKPKDSEDINRGKGRREHRDDAHEESVSLAVVLHGVVGREGYEGPEGQAEGVEHLTRCIHPYRRV